MLKSLLLLPAFFYCSILFSQHKRFEYVSVAATNSVTSKPITGYPALFTTIYHPGFEIGTGFTWKEKSRSDLSQTIRLGFFNHRFIQNSIFLYTEFKYNYHLKSWGIYAAPGLGYLHSFPATEQFKLNTTTGEYEKTGRFGRAQGMASLTIGTQRKFGEKYTGFLQFNSLLQFPFVPGYVNILPINQFHLGIRMKLEKRTAQKGGAK